MTDAAAERPAAVILMDPVQFDGVWGAEQLARLEQQVNVVATPGRSLALRDRRTFDAVEVLITGWGAQTIDSELLGRLPNLSIVLHAAGSVRSLGTADFWARGIPVVSALEANTRPTAEFAAAEIVYALKKGWQTRRRLAETRDWYDRSLEVPGLNGSVVGLVSLGRVGRYVAERLEAIGGLRVIAFDPFASIGDARGVGVELVGLVELFAQADVVSVHTPWLPETTGMITETLLRSLKSGATLINTARGAIIDEPALIRVLGERPDLFAALDVTHPEPPARDSPLFELGNVALTPHIAGSAGGERRELAESVLQQLERFLIGEPIACVTQHDLHSHTFVSGTRIARLEAAG